MRTASKTARLLGTGAAVAALSAASVTACSIPEKVAPGDGGSVDTPPAGEELETTITAAPAPHSRERTAAFEFLANMAGATFTCSVDGEPAVPCSSPFTRALDDGDHAFSVRAITPGGDGDPTPAEHLWSIDTVAPDTELVASPPATDNSEQVTFEFRANEDQASFECALDGGAFAPCQSGAMFGPVAEGAHAFAVRAIDRAGNIDPSPVNHAWVVDLSMPDTAIVGGPSGAVSATSATFTFVSADAGPGAVFQCSLDGAAYAVCTSPRTVTGLSAGAHTFAVRVRDLAGNIDPTPAVREWIVDLTPPDTTITAGPSGPVALQSVSFSFTASEPGSSFACSLDGGAYAACTSPFVTPALAQGPHTFAVRATDPAGHPDPTPATRAWIVDTVAPSLAITSGPAANATTGPYVAFAFTSDGTTACRLDDDDATPFTPCASPFAFNAPAGPHTLYIRATDAAGNAAIASRPWVVACAAPASTGAAGLLHLDDTDQQLANATGGAPATLGLNATVEAIDPAYAPGRFGSGLAFSAAEGDLVAWPVGLAAMPALTVELWVRPGATAGTRDVLVTGDGRFALRAVVSGSTVRFAATAIAAGAGGAAFTATSAAIPISQWHHVLASIGEPALRLWVDGARIEAAGVELGTGPALASLRLGGTFDGALDELWLAQTPITTDDAARARYCPL